jgi:uncharacterized membrane protein YqjE
MRLTSLFGIASQWRRLHILLGEGALAAGDRAELLRLAWEEEKKRLRWVLALVVAVAGLSLIAIALLSGAIVVQFWDSPHRAAAAWAVAALWLVLWLVSVLALLSLTGKSSSAFEPVRREFERDRDWLRRTLGQEPPGAAPPPPEAPRKTVTREELLSRIDTQRERIATLEAAASGRGEAPVPPETLGAAALRIAREHPVATGVTAAAVVAVLGPRRLVRWAGVVVPVLWRMR